MSRPVVLGCLLLAACEPVLLVADTQDARGAGAQENPAGAADAGDGSTQDAAIDVQPGDHTDGPVPSSASGPSAEPPEAQLTVKAVDCGSCFDLLAGATGGVPPYRYQWDDGSTRETRRVCVGSSELQVWVVAEDAMGSRSGAHVAYLQTDAEDAGGCGPSRRQAQMCLMNPSFEGTAAINIGSEFDAIPWSACFDPTSATVSNTPDVANNGLDWTTAIAPTPQDGTTYLALATAEQASQQLCEALSARSSTSLRLDATRLATGSADMFLQIWGGVASNCSQRQLLWVSPALNTSWDSYCVTLEPREYMDQITLRAETPMPTLAASYLAVDNLVPVDACP